MVISFVHLSVTVSILGFCIDMSSLLKALIVRLSSVVDFSPCSLLPFNFLCLNGSFYFYVDKSFFFFLCDVFPLLLNLENPSYCGQS